MDCVLALDVGSSSVRALLFSFSGEAIPGFGSQLQYHARTSEDGAWEIDTGELTAMVAQALDALCAQLREKSIRPAAVAIDTFWHSLLGVDADGKPTTPVLHPFDTRSTAAATRLAARIDNRAQHLRTGCVIHPGYLPAKLLWLSETQPEVCARTKHWMSIGEYLLLTFTGRATASTSMVSATGLWNQTASDYDAEVLAALPVQREQFAEPATLDQPAGAARWPELQGIPWFPALGDGAASNIGSGCLAQDQFALMVGTSGALRAVVTGNPRQIPDGLFCYKVDPNRSIIGGALSNGGEVFTWMRRTLRLPDDDAELEKQLDAFEPPRNRPVILPLFAGERSPGWRADARAALTGLHTATSPLEILHAALESVSLCFRQVYEIMQASLSPPRQIIATGGALLHSPAWTRMMADALGQPMIPCVEPEATSRGAALLALERLGAIHDLAALPPRLTETIPVNPGNTQRYAEALDRQRRLYDKLLKESQ